MNDSAPSFFLIETFIGVMTLSYMDHPFCLMQVLLPSEKKEASIVHYSGKAPGSRHPIRRIESLLKNYFKGRPIDPPWEVMNMDSFTRLQKAVLYETAAIPFGSLRTYRDMAIAIGLPKAYRFVGTTLAKNPYPLLIPCHRIIRSDKGMGGFGGGIELKKQLIDFESQHL
jgi:methylated-DNA-[protein]-cysteine S-methyltransferase